MATRTVSNAKQGNSRRESAPARVKVKFARPTKRNTRFPMLRVPFVQDRVRGRSERNSWAFPAVQGYGPGCDLGRQAAFAYLKALRAEGGVSGGWLQHFVIDCIAAGPLPHRGSDCGRTGIIVGFFEQVERWVKLGLSLGGSQLDAISEASIEAEMTRAANVTKEEYSADLEARLRKVTG